MDLGKLRRLSEHRECLICGKTFDTDKESTALAKFADHTTIHNPTAEQWQTAHELIEKGREKAKKSA